MDFPFFTEKNSIQSASSQCVAWTGRMAVFSNGNPKLFIDDKKDSALLPENLFFFP